MSFAIDNTSAGYNNIKVIGVGGAGGNAVNNMVEAKIVGVETIAANTDRQILEQNVASHKIILGEKITNSMGAGGDPAIGKRAAEESRDVISEALRGTDMLFIVAGMGGGTGTGGAPVVAEIAKEQGILTVAIVTKPFSWEGKRRTRQAEEGITNLEQYVDSTIIIPNDRLQNVGDKSLSIKDAYAAADDVLCKGVKSISETITVPGYINLDFADIRSVMKNGGRAHMGIGYAKGADCGIEAVNQAISSPLLESDIKGATGVIINITCSPDVPLDVIQQAGSKIQELTNPDCNVIFGSVFDESMGDEISVTVIATGYDAAKKEAAAKQTIEKINASQRASADEGEKDERITRQGKPSTGIFSRYGAPSEGEANSDVADVLRQIVGQVSTPQPAPAPQPENQSYSDVFSQAAPAGDDAIFSSAPQQQSVFDDADDDDDLPIFKGRNLFDN